MIYAKPSTSLLVVFRAYLASDHVTPATGKTIAITISKNGGAFGNPNAGATNATEITNGFYKVTLDTTDTNTSGPLAVRGAVATVDDVGVLYYVGQAPADVTHLLGTAWLTPGTAGTPDVNVKLWNALTTVALPLVPTTAGRTLDVSAGGEAGVDWANVGSPTTVVGLSGTTVKTATDVETDTADIQTRIPAALGANGNIKADLRDSIGVAVTSASGRPEVNTTHLAGTAYATAAAALVQAVWDAATSALTTVGSIGKKLADWVVGTIDTYTGNTKQTGDAFARIGAAGAGLTALGDSRIANLDATVSSRGTGTALTAADVRTALGLAAANLDTQLDALPTNAELATALAAADDAVLAAIAALNNLSAAQVNAEVVDALRTDTGTEVSSVPAAAAPISAQVQFMYQALRNKVLSGASLRIHNDAGTIIATKTQSDDGATYTEDKAT